MRRPKDILSGKFHRTNTCFMFCTFHACQTSKNVIFKHEQFPSMQIDKYRTFAKECVFKQH